MLYFRIVNAPYLDPLLVFGVIVGMTKPRWMASIFQFATVSEFAETRMLQKRKFLKCCRNANFLNDILNALKRLSTDPPNSGASPQDHHEESGKIIIRGTVNFLHVMRLHFCRFWAGVTKSESSILFIR
jgi:hypothetical protein